MLALTGSVLAAQTYYFSSETGDDANSGLSVNEPLASLGAVNALALSPGDEVRLFCGETWRFDPMQITRSGIAGSPIVYTS